MKLKIEFKKEYIPLFLAVLLPVILFSSIWAFNYFPSISLDPKYDVIYFSQKYTPGITSEYYSIDKATSRIKKMPVMKEESYEITDPKYQNIDSYDYPNLYIHNTKTNTSRKVSFDELQKIDILTTVNSPDKCKITNGSNMDYDFIFPNRYTDYGKWVMKCNGVKKDLDLTSEFNSTSDAYYDRWSNSIRILGWIQR